MTYESQVVLTVPYHSSALKIYYTATVFIIHALRNVIVGENVRLLLGGSPGILT